MVRGRRWCLEYFIVKDREVKSKTEMNGLGGGVLKLSNNLSKVE